MGRPEVRPLLDELQDVLMVDALILLGIIAFLRSGGVESRVGVRAVFRETDHPIGIHGVVLVEKLLVLLQLPQIPAEVEVVAGDVRNRNQRAVLFQHEGVGHDRWAGRIHLVAELIQLPVVLQQLLCHRAAGCDLVAQPPADDGWVVVALGDELFHLAHGVGFAFRHVLGDIRDLGPDDEAVLVAEVV